METNWSAFGRLPGQTDHIKSSERIRLTPQVMRFVGLVVGGGAFVVAVVEQSKGGGGRSSHISPSARARTGKRPAILASVVRANKCVRARARRPVEAAGRWRR